MCNCRVCRNSDKNKVIVVKQTGTQYLDEFEYIQCNKCNSLTIKEVPQNLSKYYEDYYSLKPFSQVKHLKFTSHIKRFLFLRFHNLSKLYSLSKHPLDLLALQSLLPLRISPKCKILDVGSGSGKFVYDLHNLGYKKAIGIDPFIKENLKYDNGAKIYKTELNKISDHYDVITFHHTMEHLSDLDDCLKMVKSILTPDGCCIIRIPNISSFSAKKFGPYWTGIHAPYHLILPAYEAMINDILPRNGLKLRMARGEQLYHFLLSNIDNSFNLINDGSKMFREFAPIHTRADILNYKRLAKKLITSPSLCEWICYYVVHEKSF
ncbi:MAG: hypothetical protein Tsb0015_14980 [Simkaniaceae bacterium]